MLYFVCKTGLLVAAKFRLSVPPAVYAQTRRVPTTKVRDRVR